MRKSMQQKVWIVLAAVSLACAACSNTSTRSAVAPSTFTEDPIVISPPKAVGVQVAGAGSYYERDQKAQLTAFVTLSNGFVQDRTSEATWTSSNAAVISVSNTGTVTAGNEGEATVTATYQERSGTLQIKVKYGYRAPDPPPGQNLPLPNMAHIVFEMADRYSAELQNSCQEAQWGGDPVQGWRWMDLLVDRLREEDLRWGYAGMAGNPSTPESDKIAYHRGAGASEMSTDVYIVDVVGGHCGPNPYAAWQVVSHLGGYWITRGRF
jgi:hypothetical protein